MQEIRCPHCGEVFQVDEAGYAAIVKQVRDREFTREIESREQTAVQLAVSKVEQEKDQELSALHARLKALEQEHRAEIERAQLKNQLDAQKERQTIGELQTALKNEQERTKQAVQLAVQEQQLMIRKLESDLQHEKDDPSS